MVVDAQHEQARTMGAIATVISAFGVFVLGGGVVLVSWVSAQEAVTAVPAQEASRVVRSPADGDVVETLAAPEAVDAVAAPAPKVVSPAAAPPTRRRATTRRSRPAPVEQAETTPAPVVETQPVPVDPNAKGNVHVLGDAERVRLIGSRGSFPAGDVPAGTYTIQATFEGDEPRMAGTVVVGDGARVKVICISQRRQCIRR